MEERTEIREAVDTLNWAVYGVDGKSPDAFFTVENEMVTAVLFNDEVLWNSEGDDRRFDKDLNRYEPFLPFIRAKFQDYVGRVSRYNVQIHIDTLK